MHYRARQRWALTSLAITVLAGYPAHVGRAQDPSAVLHIAPVLLVEPASESPLPIQVGPVESLPKSSFVRIRGLPAAAALSKGNAINSGVWAVPFASLPALNLILPVGLQGRWDVVVGVITIDGKVLTEQKFVLIVGSAQLIAPAPAPPAAPPAAAAAPPSPPAPPPDRTRELGMHAKGMKLMDEGNIQAARLLFRHAAEAGLAQSALALAASYDPDELAKLRVVGMQPDVAAARQWYEKARELGAPEAAERLQRLQRR